MRPPLGGAPTICTPPAGVTRQGSPSIGGVQHLFSFSPFTPRAMSSSAPPDLYCVIGNPVAHSRSPAIHARFAELTGERLVYERCLLPIDGFAQGVRAFMARGGRGCNVTVPFKLEAAALATTRSERVQRAGAANTLVFDGQAIHADNTDGLGLVADIERNAGVPLAGRDVLAGGRRGRCGRRAGPPAAGRRAPRHGGQSHAGAGAGAGAGPRRSRSTTKSRADCACTASARGQFRHHHQRHGQQPGRRHRARAGPGAAAGGLAAWPTT